MEQHVCRSALDWEKVYVDENSMSVVQHWIGKRSVLVRIACICSSALECEKVYVGENSMYL